MKNQKSTNTSNSGFTCANCGKLVSGAVLGTAHRNHCPYCLWSLHVDADISGDRLARCCGKMEPIGLTLKAEGVDKYTGKPKEGEIMIIHHCMTCGKISINRIAGDDNPENILALVAGSKRLDDGLSKELAKAGIRLVTFDEKEKVVERLFGKK